MPSTIDFIAPFDTTGYPSITGAQLLQLVTGLAPNTDTGLNLVTADIAGIPQVPNASVTTKWQHYTWIRQSATYVTAYVWNANGATDATFLNWVTLASAAIGPGTIMGYMIYNSTIPSTAIISISSTQITGSTVPGWLAQLNLPQTAYATNGLMNNNSPIFGVMNGAGSTVDTPVFGSEVIPSTAYGLQTIAGNATALASPITDNSITTRQLLNNGSGASIPLLIGAVDPANNITLPTQSVIGIPAVASAKQAVVAGDVLGVSYNKTGYETINRAVLNLPDPDIASADTLKLIQVVGAAYALVTPASVFSGAAITFASAQVNIAVGNAINVAHGLPSLPSIVRAVLVNITTNDNGYTVGDEIDITSIGYNTPEQHPVCSWGANATNVFFTFDNGSGGNGSITFKVKNKGTGAEATLNNTYWQVKMYARV